jgi:hypothetical protein
MPKSISNLLKNVVRLNNEFSTDGKILKCEVCNVCIKYDLKHGSSRLKGHKESDTHKNNLKTKSISSRQSTIPQWFES